MCPHLLPLCGRQVPLLVLVVVVSVAAGAAVDPAAVEAVAAALHQGDHRDAEEEGHQASHLRDELLGKLLLFFLEKKYLGIMCFVVLYLEAMLREVVDLLVLQAVHEELEHHD